MAMTLSEEDLAARVSDVRDRVGSGERFAIERDGEIVAVLARPEPQAVQGISGRELAARVGDLMPPEDGFGDDLEVIHAARGTASAPQCPD